MKGTRVLLAASAMVLAACGGASSTSTVESVSTDGPSSTAGATAPTEPAGPVVTVSTTASTSSLGGAGSSLEVRPESKASSQLPTVVVRQVQTGEDVQLKNLLPAAKPLLVWFWAPH